MKAFKSIPRAVWALGFVSLLMDVSSEIVHGLLPVFLITSLAASYTMVGLIEGLGESFALFFKVFSGPLSDKLGKRKPLVVLGYVMGALSKPLFAIAPNPLFVLGARLFDRTGKGIRGAPRDALIADVTPPDVRGQSFGIRQTLDTIGSILGPLIAILLMSMLANNYRLVFAVAIIPGVLAVLVLLFGVQEPETQNLKPEKKFVFKAALQFGPAFWLVSICGAFFQLARFSEAFLILRAQNLGLSLSLAPLALVAMNVIYSASAYPLGWISDHVRREWLILGGFFVLVLSDLALAFAENLTTVWLGVGLWGLHLGFTQGVLSALVADTCPSSYRGTAYGVFNLLSAIALLLASAIAGILWDQKGPQSTFLFSASLAVLGMFVLLMCRPYWTQHK